MILRPALFASTAPFALTALSLAAAPLAAQTVPVGPSVAGAASAPPSPAPESASDDDDAEEITVVARRDPTAVIGDIPPENSLSSRDIRAYGTSSVIELLDALAPQLGSGRGRASGPPVVLLNGRRISGFREVRDLPPEAILRLDVLPEEVALKYGYRADQRVVNIVLRPRFRSTSARAEGRVPSEGGSSAGEFDVTRLMIGDNGRTTLNARIEGSSALREDERSIALGDAGAGTPDPRPFRTLIASSSLGRVGASHNRTLFGDVSSTLDGQLERSRGRSLLGPSLLSSGDPLARETDRLSGRVGIALNGQKARWRWSVTGAYERARSVTETDRENALLGLPFEDRARTLSGSGNLDLVLTGPVAELPAGRATATLRLGADTRDLESRARRAGIVTATDLSRDRGSGSINLDLPVAKRGGALSALGNLTLNANAEVERLSDFGTLTTLGGGFFWSPLERLNLIASWTREEGAPSLNQLGDPFLVTPASRIFDFTTGRTVLVDAVTGGNPDLLADRRRVFKFGGSFQPVAKLDLNLRADYVRTRIDDPVSGFPGVTAAIEAAFPDRFARDQTGKLVRVDLRPVNFSRSNREELRWGFNFTRPLTSARPPQALIDQFRRQRQEATGTAAPSGAGEVSRPDWGRRGEAGQSGGERGGVGGDRGGFGGGSGGFGGRGGGGGNWRQGGRLTASLYHTWIFRDEVRIASGLPALDYLSGEVIEGGFRPAHRLEGDLGWFNNGLGARLSGTWQDGGRVGSGEDRLDFQSLATFNLSLFANLGERFDLVVKRPWLRGAQLRFGVQNILNSKQKVRDVSRNVPLSYQPDLVDPQGRTISLSIRKLFLPPPQFLRGTRPAN